MTSRGDVAKGGTEGVHTIRRKYYGKVPREPQTRRNREIRISPLRVIDQDGKQVGVIERDEALRMAEEAGLDLVEVQANIRPPLCKIMDFGKYKYEQSKKKAQKPPKANEIKEVRLGRSVKIDKHDVELRVNQARKFILEGHRVMFVQRFRGREMAHPHLGEERLKAIAELLSDVAMVTSPAKLNGRQMTMAVAPDKSKIDKIRAQKAKEEAAQAEAEPAPDDGAETKPPAPADEAPPSTETEAEAGA
ncbi:MAG: translation initiation factor IF-3 [Myxococcota bacterium]